jgi:hypothetical protein
MKPLKHWQDAANAVLGAWLLLSPWALAYAIDRVATGNALIVGIALMAVAFGAMLVPKAWEEWSEAALGLWLVVSPWALGFSGIANAMLVAAATGAVVLALALWALATDPDYSAWLVRKKAQ